jgi:hypothetical protein
MYLKLSKKERTIEAISNKCVWLIDWEMCGDASRVSEKYLTPIITKTLITTRYRINQLIDADAKRPDDVSGPYWKKLVALRHTEAARQKSAQMRSISLSKVSTSKQMKAIERQVVSRLVSMEDGSFFVIPLSLMFVHYCLHVKEDVAGDISFDISKSMCWLWNVDHGPEPASN